MAHALAWNLNRGQRDVRLFEIGRAYAHEERRAGGDAHPHASAPRAWRAKRAWPNRQREYEFADLKGDLDQIGELAGGFAWSAPSQRFLAACGASAGSSARRRSQATQRPAHRQPPENSHGASPNDSSCARTFFSPSCRSLRSTPAAAAARAARQLPADFALSVGRARFFADPRATARRSPPCAKPSQRWASRRLLRSKPWICSAARTCRPENFRCWCA